MMMSPDGAGSVADLFLADPGKRRVISERFVFEILLLPPPTHNIPY
jgi:hypothetical protein